MVREGTFRADLFYRLNVIPITLPPLRERREDIRELAEHFLRLYAPQGKTLRLTDDFVASLEAHDWPGNVRELANCLRRAVALAAGCEIGKEALQDSAWNKAAGKNTVETTAADSHARKPDQISDEMEEKMLRAGVSLGDMERRLVEMTLEATGGNRSRAAALLGVSLRTVRNKIRSYGLPSWSSYVHD
jgi:DNA-binding NtrC family response regulator